MIFLSFPLSLSLSLSLDRSCRQSEGDSTTIVEVADRLNRMEELLLTILSKVTNPLSPSFRETNSIFFSELEKVVQISGICVSYVFLE